MVASQEHCQPTRKILVSFSYGFVLRVTDVGMVIWDEVQTCI